MPLKAIMAAAPGGRAAARLGERAADRGRRPAVAVGAQRVEQQVVEREEMDLQWRADGGLQDSRYWLACKIRLNGAVYRNCLNLHARLFRCVHRYAVHT